MIHFQALVKNELSKLELLKCCCRTSNSDNRQTSQVIRVLKYCGKFSFQYKTNYCALQYCCRDRKDINSLYDTIQTLGYFKRTSIQRQYYHP